MRIFIGDVVYDFIRLVCYLFAAGRLSRHVYFFYLELAAILD
jgi:hypothetical protein